MQAKMIENEDSVAATLYVNLKEILTDAGVDLIYDNMTPGQRAHMFNKLLKHQGYNASSLSIERIDKLYKEIAEAQR